MSVISEEEKEAIKYLEFLINEKCECEACQHAKKEYKTILNLLDKQQKEIEDYKKFKKDIVSKIMIWDKEELPDNEVIISMLDTFVAEVSRLEDIEDKKVEVAVDFIEAKRDKFWKDKISKKIKEFEQTRNVIANVENQDLNYDMKRNDYCIKMLNELLEDN